MTEYICACRSYLCVAARPLKHDRLCSHLDVIVRNGNSRQACRGTAGQRKVSVEGGSAFQLEAVGAGQEGSEGEGQREGL